jgi:y4mF family transcriptional regulator
MPTEDRESKSQAPSALAEAFSSVNSATQALNTAQIPVIPKEALGAMRGVTIPKEMLDAARAATFPKELLDAVRGPTIPKEALDAARAVTFPKELLDAVRGPTIPKEALDAARAVTFPKELLDAVRGPTIPKEMLDALKRTTPPRLSHPKNDVATAPAHSPLSALKSPADLGALVRAARKAAGLDQQALADLAGVGRRFVSELENGKATLEFGKVLTVAAALGIDLLARKR